MTVGELKEALAQFPDSLPVHFEDCEGMLDEGFDIEYVNLTYGRTHIEFVDGHVRETMGSYVLLSF